MKAQLFRIILCILTGYMVSALPTGAPKEACGTLKPKHNNTQPQQASTFPYVITASGNSFTTDKDSIKVSISSKIAGPAFKGFLVIAKDQQGKPFGSWQSNNGAHSIECAAITHNTNNDKRIVSLTWKPPTNSTTSSVVMAASVVQNFTTYWVNIPVKVEKLAKLPSILTPSPSTTVASIPKKETTLKTTPKPQRV